MRAFHVLLALMAASPVYAHASVRAVEECEVLLVRNENPLGPSPRATKAITDALGSKIHRYPDPAQKELKAALSEKLKVPAEQIVLGNGSDEFIASLLQVIGKPKGNVVSHRYSYFGFKKFTEAQGVQFIEAPLAEQFRVDVEAILKATNENTSYVILANPVNPSGAFLTHAEAHLLASELGKRGVTLVLDSAYREYVTDHEVADPFEIQKTHSNVIVLGTFSKIYGLAGLRVGYLVARPDVAARFERVRQTGNVSTIALIAAKEALKDSAHLERTLKVTAESLSELQKKLPTYGFEVYPTQGNFVMVNIHRSADELVQKLSEHSVAVLSLSSYGLPTYVRITLGLPEENQRLFRALDVIVP